MALHLSEMNKRQLKCAVFQYLMQQEGAMAGQSTAVIHHSWDVPEEG